MIEIEIGWRLLAAVIILALVLIGYLGTLGRSRAGRGLPGDVLENLGRKPGAHVQ